MPYKRQTQDFVYCRIQKNKRFLFMLFFYSWLKTKLFSYMFYVLYFQSNQRRDLMRQFLIPLAIAGFVFLASTSAVAFDISNNADAVKSLATEDKNQTHPGFESPSDQPGETSSGADQHPAMGGGNDASNVKKMRNSSPQSDTSFTKPDSMDSTWKDGLRDNNPKNKFAGDKKQGLGQGGKDDLSKNAGKLRKMGMPCPPGHGRNPENICEPCPPGFRSENEKCAAPECPTGQQYSLRRKMCIDSNDYRQGEDDVFDGSQDSPAPSGKDQGQEAGDNGSNQPPAEKPKKGKLKGLKKVPAEPVKTIEPVKDEMPTPASEPASAPSPTPVTDAPCPEGQIRPAGGSECVACPPRMLPHADGTRCVIQRRADGTLDPEACPPGFRISEEGCAAPECPDSQQYSIRQNRCVDSAAFRYGEDDRPAPAPAPSPAPEPEAACPSGQIRPAGGSECIACPPRMVPHADGTRCVIQRRADGTLDPEACPPGFRISEEGCAAPECPDGQQYSIRQSRCIDSATFRYGVDDRPASP